MSHRTYINKLKGSNTAILLVKDELVSMKSLEYIPKKENIRLNVLEKSSHFIYDETEWGYMETELVNMIL